MPTMKILKYTLPMMMGLNVLLSASSAMSAPPFALTLAWQGEEGQALQVGYRQTTPSDVIKMEPGRTDEIRYQIRLYEALEAIAKELEQELLEQEMLENSSEFEGLELEGLGEQQAQEPMIQLEFEVLPSMSTR